MKTRWKDNVPSCTKGKRHRWHDSEETGVCSKCGYDVFDERYYKIKYYE